MISGLRSNWALRDRHNNVPGLSFALNAFITDAHDKTTSHVVKSRTIASAPFKGNPIQRLVMLLPVIKRFQSFITNDTWQWWRKIANVYSFLK